MDGAAVMGGLQTAGQPAGGCETESRLGGMADGIPPEMDGHSMWAKEPAQIPYLISDPPANVAKGLSLCHIALDYSSTISASQTFSVSTSGQQNFAVPGSLPGTVPP